MSMGDESKKTKLDNEELLAAEEATLQDISGVLEAMDTMENYESYSVIRDGKELFSFRVRGLDDEEMDRCRSEATKYVRNKKMGGITMPTNFNTAKYNSLLIVQATHPDDKKYLWENKELQKRADALTAYQTVDRVLRAGEKERAIELIEDLSGYESSIEILKNS